MARMRWATRTLQRPRGFGRRPDGFGGRPDRGRGSGPPGPLRTGPAQRLGVDGVAWRRRSARASWIGTAVSSVADRSGVASGHGVGRTTGAIGAVGTSVASYAATASARA
ncbi:hypothetical protein [Streptomyces sp. NPDC056987]|uniref:hypothetical protein n=1 Tax=Streptomyces sp. NPDC056987 TaxID=3345988 RepID=UPI003626BCA4